MASLHHRGQHHDLGRGDANLHVQQSTTQSQRIQQCLQMMCAACHKADVICIHKLTGPAAGPASLEHGPPAAMQPVNEEAKQGGTQVAPLS